MKFIIVLLFLFCKFANGIYLNPYSYGSYDPAAEDPNLYNYYARYYNPNKHNPYAPYPTYMKPGVFRLPRMYQIDPAWAPYYPPNRFETLPLAQGNNIHSRALGESTAIFPTPDGCGDGIIDQNINENKRTKEPKSETELLLEDLNRGGNGGYIGRKNQISKVYFERQEIRPQWSATQPTSEHLAGFAQRPTLIRPRVSHPSSGLSNDPRSGCSSGCGGESNDPRSSPTFEGERAPQSGCALCDEYGNPKPPPQIEGGGCVQCGGGNEGSTDNISNDFERLPLDRINSSPDSDSSGFPNPSGSSNFYRNRKIFNIRRY